MKERLTCTVDNQGRIMLPARWRKDHGVGPQSELLVTFEDGRLIVETRRQAICRAQEIVARSVHPGVSLVDELLKARRAEAAAEERESRRHRSTRA